MGVSQNEGSFKWDMGVYRAQGLGFRVSQNYGYFFGGPDNKDHRILGSMLGSPYLGKLPHLKGFELQDPGIGFRVLRREGVNLNQNRSKRQMTPPLSHKVVPNISCSLPLYIYIHT